jgi:hypothetical protein
VAYTLDAIGGDKFHRVNVSGRHNADAHARRAMEIKNQGQPQAASNPA